MKRRTTVLIKAVCLAICLTACGSNASHVEVEQIPEASSKEMLAQGIEYLLEETNKQADAEDADTEPEEKETAIYYSAGVMDKLQTDYVVLSEVSAEELIRNLATKNIVSLDTKALSLTEEDADGQKLLTLDLSAAFGDYLETMTEEAEYIILSAVSNTFLECFEADGIYILVEGLPLKTVRGTYESAFYKEMPYEIPLRNSMPSETEATE